MKKSFLLIFGIIVCFASCKNFQYLVTEVKTSPITNCPENSDCLLELIPNSTISFKNHEFGNTYPTITEGNKTLLKYTFNKKTPKNTQDGQYTEHVYAELEPTITKTALKNAALKNIKLHFGRLCFCKGETGYYPIKNGEFNIKKVGENTISISINFKILEVPQITTNINETISLK